MNGVTVTIGETDYQMRWEVGALREMQTMHPDLKGPDLAWQLSAFDFSALLALWHASLMCSEANGGLPRMKVAEAEALMQAYMDEGHTTGEVRNLIGEAGIAGHFLTRSDDAAAPAEDAAPLGTGTKPRKTSPSASCT